jgi:serine/threonine-protein kinase
MPPSAETWERVQEIFNAAADLPSGDRAALLERECAGDVTLRDEVESLLASDEQATSFIEDPASAMPRDLLDATAEEEDFAGRRFGAYRVLREIGRGGLGAVYLAARADEQFEKQVAIKVVKRGLDTDDILRRFRAERQILAQLDHPNIGRLTDAGSTEEGLPYFVMEYVEGESITSYCETHRLSTAARLKLFRDVCSAISYAHQHLVIHRDIKPSNILVTKDGVPKLLDFGIAKVLHSEDPLAAHTMTGIRVMTPEYASPEQVRGLPINTASDIYSLGVLLYELLTNQKPYRLTSNTSEELSRAVLDQIPERPSTAVALRGDNLGGAVIDQSSLRGDLDNIVLMAMRKEPERRYASAAAFADDIWRHLEGLPVLAHKDTVPYRASKFVRRHALGVTAAGLVLLTLVGGIIATAWQGRRATRHARQAEEQARVASAERDRAQREGAKAQGINTFLQNILGFSDPTWMATRGNAHQTTIAEAIDEAARRAETELADQPEVLAAVQHSIGRIYENRGRVDRAEALLRSSLEIRRGVLGPEHPETAQSMASLGETCVKGGKTAEADTLLRDAVAILRQTQNRSLTDTKWLGVALSGLGTAQVAKGDAAEGERFLLEALQATDKLLGDDRNIIPMVLHNLGALRFEQGDVDRAIAYLQRAVEENRQASADLRFSIANNLSNLGSYVAMTGDHAKAESLLHESIALYRATIGEESQKITFPMIHLAHVHYLRGNFPQAREVIDHVIGIQHRVLSHGHIDFSRSWLVLGNILTRTGEAAGGETYLRKALELRGRTYAEGHWRLAEVHMALGNCLAEQERHAEAEPLLLASHSALDAKLGPQDPRTLDARRSLVQLYETTGKAELAAGYR